MVALSPSILQPNVSNRVHSRPLSSLSSAKPPRTVKISASYTSTAEQPGTAVHKHMASLSLYEVLGISSSATCHEIKTAYRKLARVCHPDVVAVNQRETSACQFKKIHEAYSTLSDPHKRASYDRDLYGRSARVFSSSSAAMAAAAASMSRFSGFACKNWETDQCW